MSDTIRTDRPNGINPAHLCQDLHNQMKALGLDTEDQLSILISMIVGIVNVYVTDPVQRQIHTNQIIKTIRENVDGAETTH